MWTDRRTGKCDKATRRLPRITQKPLVRLNYVSRTYISFLTRCRQHARSCKLHDIYKFGLSHPEDGGYNLLRNIGKYLAVNVVQHSKRLEKSSVLL
jgi:hypothetical protein